jgi:hypothetical protein
VYVMEGLRLTSAQGRPVEIGQLIDNMSVLQPDTNVEGQPGRVAPEMNVDTM